MSSTDPIAVHESSFQKKDKKSKREKGEHKSKKRQREADAEPDDERNHKRSKSEILTNGESGQRADKKSKKHKKKHQSQELAEESDTQAPTSPITTAAPTDEPAATADSDEDRAERKRRKQEKKEKRRKERELKFRNREGLDGEDNTTQAPEAPSNDDAMDIDMSPAKTPSQRFDKLPEKPYPFFTQRVSQYLPLFPLGMIQPLEGYADQHLKPLLNHYVPTFKGVLLGYRDVEIGEAPGQGSITEQSEMADEAMLESIDEYAVAFGWLTAKVDLFRPSRGAWLEGSINLQSEGHLGVVCWGMFNASIEAARLPKGWQWVNLLGKGRSKGRDKTPEEAKLPTPEPADEGEEDVSQLHTTGYWVDDDGQRVKGTLRFQIKNFEVGVSGDYGYLSIEGTMLDEGAEKSKTAGEMEAARRRKLRQGASRSEMKRLPEFSMTKFGMDEKEKEEEEPKLADA